MKRILVVYHSQEKGNTRKMADLVAQGCRSVPGVETELVNVNAADAPINPGEGSISADGRVIAWDSHGYLSAPADASGAWTSIYVRDRMTNQTEQIGGIGTGPKNTSS